MDVDLHRAKRIYQKLMRLAPDLAGIKELAKSEVGGYMALSCEILEAGRDFPRWVTIGRIPMATRFLILVWKWQFSWIGSLRKRCPTKMPSSLKTRIQSWGSLLTSQYTAVSTACLRRGLTPLLNTGTY